MRADCILNRGCQTTYPDSDEIMLQIQSQLGEVDAPCSEIVVSGFFDRITGGYELPP